MLQSQYHVLSIFVYLNLNALKDDVPKRRKGTFFSNQMSDPKLVHFFAINGPPLVSFYLFSAYSGTNTISQQINVKNYVRSNMSRLLPWPLDEGSHLQVVHSLYPPSWETV